MTQPPRHSDSPDGYARDRLGRILRDRYGNPVPRRETGPSPDPRDGRFAADSPEDNHTRVLGNSRSPQPNSPRTDGPEVFGPMPPQYRRDQARYAVPVEGIGNSYGNGSATGGNRQPSNYRAPLPGQAPPQPPRRGGRPPTARPPRRRRRRPRLGRILGVLVLLLVLVVGGTAWWVDSSLNRIDALASSEGRPGNTKGTNWLLVGSDSREGLSESDGERYAAGDLTEGGQRTDTIIVVHVPSFGGKPTMVSIPRDSYVEIPGYGTDKINAAFSYGGPQLLQQTVEHNTGMRIDHYMELGFAGFAGIVDAVGGVTLCPKEPIDDPMAGLNVLAGCQKMDGPTALGYVRTRYTSTNGDLDRVERQREFLTAVIKKVGSLSTMINPFRALPLTQSLTDAITVDNGDHVWHLAALGLGLARGSEQQTVPVSGFADTDAGSVVLWDDVAADALFSKMR